MKRDIRIACIEAACQQAQSPSAFTHSSEEELVLRRLPQASYYEGSMDNLFGPCSASGEV